MRVSVSICVGVCLLASLGCESYTYSTRDVTLTQSDALEPESKTQTLTIKLNESGEPVEYATDVRSVYCLDTECEVIAVRLVWDPLGVYQRYEIPAGRNLTKDDHAVFKRADHRVLHRLLADANSQVKRVDPRELLEAERARRKGDTDRPYGWRNPEYGVDAPDDDTDAVSTPTPVDLKSLVVPGAAYTSLTLWNWANGELPGHVRAITREAASRSQLMRWLRSDDAREAAFALEALTHRRWFDADTRGAVLDRCGSGSGDVLRAAWRYLAKATAATADERLAVYARLLGRGDSPLRVFALERLAEQKNIPRRWYTRLVDHVDRFESYYEFHLFLSQLTDRKVTDPAVREAVAAHRDHADPFIARRVSEYLHAPNGL